MIMVTTGQWHWLSLTEGPGLNKPPSLSFQRCLICSQIAQIQSLTLILAPLICLSGPSVLFFPSYLTVSVEVSVFIALSINNR